MQPKRSEWRNLKIISILTLLSLIWIAMVFTMTSRSVSETGKVELDLSSGSATSGKLFSWNKIQYFPEDEIMFSEWSPMFVSRPESRFQCKKWSVVTTIFQPSDAVRRQANQGPDWCLVVVGDQKSPPSYTISESTSHVVYLDPDQQRLYAERFPDLFGALPWNHFGRKNVGFLYAIEQGAEFIWDFDDDNILKDNALIPTPSDSDLIEVQIPEQHQFSTYNPYMRMGAPHHPTWPRGLPLPHIKQPDSYQTELVRKQISAERIGLIQSLADHDPDLDAIYRLTQPLPFDFDPGADTVPIILPARVLAPLNAQACLFRRSAFWMLLLPITVHGRVSDIWRGYAGQRLLWDLGLSVTFSPPLVDQFRNPHDYLADLDSEIPLYLRAGALVDSLLNFHPKSDTLPGRIEELWIDLYERGYVDIEDVRLQQHWIKALDLIGYQFPSIIIPQAQA